MSPIDLERFRAEAGRAGAAVLNTPTGYGTDNWVPDNVRLPFAVSYKQENVVSRPTQEIRIVATLDDGGLSTLGDLWEYGAPAQGPLAGFSDDRAWATSLTTDHGHDRDEALYLPPIDLSGAVSPSLSMRTWFALNNDAMTLEVWDPLLGWTHLGGVTPAYNTTDVFGYAAWRQPSGRDLWDLVGADLSLYAGQIVYVRVVFRSNDSWLDAGVFLDDLAVEEGGADPDGDGLFGVLDERGTYGTDPFLADTDGDGTDDGAEVTAGTDPLDPASHP